MDVLIAFVNAGVNDEYLSIANIEACSSSLTINQ